MDERNNEEVRIYDKYFIDANNKQIDEILPILNKFESQIDVFRNNFDNFSGNSFRVMDSICNFKKYSNIKNEKFQEKVIEVFSDALNEFQKSTEIIIKDFIELKQIYKNIINTIIFPPLKIENLSSFKVENKLNLESNSYDLNNITSSYFRNCVDEHSENFNVNDNEEQKEYLKCLKCKKNAEILYKNNYYCKTCYLNEAVFYEEDKILDKDNLNDMKNEE